MPHKLALIGFGVVGQGLAELLRDKGDTLRHGLGFDAQVVAVADISHGNIGVIDDEISEKNAQPNS